MVNFKRHNLPSKLKLRNNHSGKMVALFNSLFFGVLNFVFYHVKYYDYIVKWCSGVACNWCVSLNIALIFAFVP